MNTRILICEDNKPNLDLMVYLLCHSGYKVLTAMDGETGLQMCQDEKPDLMICDIQLPKMDGMEVIRHLKSADSAISRIPIIAITAYAMVGDKQKILASGCDGYISKPIEPQTFVAQIEEYLPYNQRIAHLKKDRKAGTNENAIHATQLDYKGTILLIDDNLADRYLSEMLLKSIHLKPLLAGSINEALKILENTIPDLILSDYHLPDSNGGELLKIVKSSPLLRNIPFIMISSSIPVKQQSLYKIHSEVEMIIYRPIEPQIFLDIIEKTWKRSFDSKSICSKS